MSEREQALQIIEAMPEYKITALLTFLRAFDEIPNAETIAAMEETERDEGMSGSFDNTEELIEALNA